MNANPRAPSPPMNSDAGGKSEPANRHHAAGNNKAAVSASCADSPPPPPYSSGRGAANAAAAAAADDEDDVDDDHGGGGGVHYGDPFRSSRSKMDAKDDFFEPSSAGTSKLTMSPKSCRSDTDSNDLAADFDQNSRPAGNTQNSSFFCPSPLLCNSSVKDYARSSLFISLLFFNCRHFKSFQ